MKKLFILCLFCFLICGCSYRELNEMAIANSIGIDYEDGKYTVTAQVMKINKSEDTSTSYTTILYEGEGDTIVDAVRSISLQYPDYLYLGHLELLIVGKGAVSNGIDKCFDYFLRSPEARNDILLLVSLENDAKDILNPKEEEKEDFPTKDIITTIENSMKINGQSVNVNLEEFIANYLNKGIDSVVSSIAINDNDNDFKNTRLSNIAVFKNNKYIANLKKEDAIIFNVLNNKIEDVLVNLKYKDKVVSVIITETNCDTYLKIKNNKVYVDINMDLKGLILSTEETGNIADEKHLKKIESIANEEIKNYVNSLIQFNKDNDTDILGLKSMIYKHYNKDYNKYKDLNIYDIANIDINSNIDIYRYGHIYRGIVGGYNE